MATHCSTLAWKIQGTEEPGGLSSMGLQSRTQLMRLSSSSSSSSSSRELHVLLVQLHNAGLFAYAIPHARILLLILDSCASPVWPSESYKLVQAWACDSFWTQEHQPWGFVGTFRKGTAQEAEPKNETNPEGSRLERH